MMSSLRARLWLSYAFLIVIALAIVAAVLILFLVRNPNLYRQATLRLGVAEGVLLRTPLTGGQLESLAQAFGVRAQILSPDGNLIMDSAPSLSLLKLPTTLANARSVATARDQTGRLWLYVVARRADGNWLVVATPRPGLAPAVTVLTDELVRPMMQGGVIALLLALVLAYGLARWIADPLQRLMAATRQFGEKTSAPGSPPRVDPVTTSPVPESGPHEVRQLTRAFNSMVGRVQGSQRAQRDLIANVSHELKTPLTSIQGFAQALLDGAAESPAARRHSAEVIHDEAGRMHRMVVELLDLARLDAGTAEMQIAAVDIGWLLGGVVDRFKPIAAQADIGLQADIEGTLPTLAADGDRLAQVFTNLLDNAVKFTPRGGHIRVSARREGGEIQVIIQDTGAGISTGDLPRIFDRFYQADAARGGGEMHGAGLGLSIAQEIVKTHGGRITVRSTPGRGSEFIVHLPVQSGLKRP